MTTIELRIKFENLYEALNQKYHEVCPDGIESYNDEVMNEACQMESNFKRLFWSIVRRTEKEDGTSYDSLRWQLRHGDYIDFFWKYNYFFGRVPSWQRS